MNLVSSFKKIETFASCYGFRASIELIRVNSFRIVLRRSETGERFWFYGSLFFLSQRRWLNASLRGAVSQIFSSPGFSEKTETVLHDASHASQIEQETPLWL